HTLYGFLTQRERMMFQSLIGVSGVGANTARMLLSSIQPSELEGVIMAGDAKRLKSVKGVGSKTAERIIVDLRDKIKPLDDTQLPLTPETESASDVFDEALSALVMLGFGRPQSQKVLRKIFDSNPAVKVEAAIKLALTMM
ncbi:MAG: Holliday junction branch migration protein RuvA, partial [Paramuribaculum sp.]|nr:Holliday junction branch migration protein RuvA [Paramuribaculum sp.]